MVAKGDISMSGQGLSGIWEPILDIELGHQLANTSLIEFSLYNGIMGGRGICKRPGKRSELL
jgi:hypothetical protein